MEREIRFRAWDTDRNKMIIPSPRQALVECCSIIELLHNVPIPGGMYQTKITRSFNGKLLEYTGLKDKNGKEGYFSDIVKYKDQAGREQVGVIEDYGYFSGYIEAIGGDDEGNQDGELHPDEEFEIIGNIYENPELLKATP